MVRPFLGLASPAGTNARLCVLVLHRVLAQPDDLFPDAMHAARFAELCRWLTQMFHTLPLDEAVQRLKAGTLPTRALSITFDDGYADNLHVAMPILQSHGLAATVFVTTGMLDGGCMWNDVVIESFRRTRETQVDLRDVMGPAAGPFSMDGPVGRRQAAEAVIGSIKYLEAGQRAAMVAHVSERTRVQAPTDLMLTRQEVIELRRGGMQVGAHTVSHPILTRLSPDDARREIGQSKHYLEELLGERVGLFAYPNGKPGEDYDDSSVAMVRDLGFDAAVTTVRGAASGASDLLQIPRFTPWDRSRLRFGARMLSTLWASRKVPIRPAQHGPAGT